MTDQHATPIASELLAALKALVAMPSGQYSSSGDFDAVHDAALAAIAKAEAEPAQPPIKFNNDALDAALKDADYRGTGFFTFRRPAPSFKTVDEIKTEEAASVSPIGRVNKTCEMDDGSTAFHVEWFSTPRMDALLYESPLSSELLRLYAERYQWFRKVLPLIKYNLGGISHLDTSHPMPHCADQLDALVDAARIADYQKGSAE